MLEERLSIILLDHELVTWTLLILFLSGGSMALIQLDRWQRNCKWRQWRRRHKKVLQSQEKNFKPKRKWTEPMLYKVNLQEMDQARVDEIRDKMREKKLEKVEKSL